ncbi:MFS general substrate transporter [Teratosphaeria destructans]|uniref:MFS general substrate transporter n=1 Tax=Teratosphaeria destructans TaxID=418781 RepID=A0A9W7SJQ1_9PEZI|nr:MFS general substrate transporter [Teratosphaeria destructans]
MSTMSITTYNQQTVTDVLPIQHPSVPPTTRHPHPLRSHGVENIDISKSINTARKTHKRSLSTRIDASVLSDLRRIRGPDVADGGNGSNDVLPRAPRPSSTYSTFRSPQAERLGNATAVSTEACGKDHPCVSSRPPLRPSISFGGEKRMSYHSLSLLALEKKPGMIVVEEEVSDVDRQARSTGWRPCGSYVVLCLLSFLGGLNFTLLSAALPALAVDLSIGAVASFWTATSFILAAALVQPLAMRMSQVSGRKGALLIGLPLFGFGSIICAASQNITGLLVGRVTSGCGYGTISVISQLIVRQLAGPVGCVSVERAVTAMYWVGAALGPITGGIAVQTLGWRCSFWISVPLSGLSMAALAFILRLPPGNRIHWNHFLNIDYFGWLLLTAALTTFMLAISWAGSMYAWSSWHTLVPLLASLIILASFIVYTRYRIEPILPPTIFRHPSALVSCFGSLTHGMIISAIVYLMPVCFAVTHGLGPAVVGAALGAWPITLVVTGVAASIATSHIGYRWMIWLGWALTIAGTAVLVVSNQRAPTAFGTSLGLIAAFGLGLLDPTLSIAVQAAATTDDEAMHAAPLHSFFHTIGQALGLIVGSSIFLNHLEQSTILQITLASNAHKYVLNAVGITEAIRSPSLANTGFRKDLVVVWSNALEEVWITMSIFAAVAIMLALWFTQDGVPPWSGRRNRGHVSSIV